MEILCPKCQKKYVVADSFAGKQARCKSQACGQVFTVAPRAASAPKPAAAVPAKPTAAAGGSPAMSSLLDELPPMSMDNLPQAGTPSVLASNYRPSRAKGPRKSLSALWLLLGGGVVGVLIVACLLVFMMSNSGGSGGTGKGASAPSVAPWSPYDYIPENARMIAYVDVDELRKSELYAEVRKLVGAQSQQVPGDFDPDDLSEVFLAGSGFGANDEPLVSLRMNKDRSLKDLLPTDRRAEPTKSYQNIEYAAAGKSAGGKERFLAKTGDRAFCGAPTEEMLKQTIERLARKERAKLAPNLQSALDAVAGSRLYVAGIAVKDPRMPFTIDRFFGRAFVTSSVRIELTVVFADATQAATCKKKIDEMLAGLRMMSVMMPADKKKVLESILSALNIQPNGAELRCEGTWQNQDILAFMKMAKESGGMVPMPPGASPGMMPPGAFPGGPPGGPPPVPGAPGQ
jgi:hypothetical protein